MGQLGKLFEKIMRGTSDQSIGFTELCSLLDRLGFRERTKGSHHIFTKQGVEEMINIQPNGGSAKAYQVKQVRNLVLKYKITGDHL